LAKSSASFAVQDFKDSYRKIRKGHRNGRKEISSRLNDEGSKPKRLLRVPSSSSLLKRLLYPAYGLLEPHESPGQLPFGPPPHALT
jgi:hypothetical protein